VKIDDRIEPLVRNALDAAVRHDEDRFDAALRGFPDDLARAKGLELAISICLFALIDAYGGVPSAAQTRAAAEEIAGMEEWAGVSVDDVHRYLTAVLNRQLVDAMDAQTAVMLTFIVTASILASSSKLQDGEWWFNYLDRVEAALESQTS
jgi:hypothetical protein